MVEKSNSKLKLYSASSASEVLDLGLRLVGVLGTLGTLLSMPGLIRLRSSTVSSQSVGSLDWRFELLLWPPVLEDDKDDDDDEEDDVDDFKEPFTFANARGCMLFLLFAPPRGMMVLST